MENQNVVAANAAQNEDLNQVIKAAKQQVEAGVYEAPVVNKSKLEIATSVGEGARKLQKATFGTHFGKDGEAVDYLMRRVKEQLAKLPVWEANLKALQTELQQKKADQSFEQLKEMFSFLTDAQKAALQAI